MSKPFRYAIFDMDGLMFDTERLFLTAFSAHVGPTLNLDFPEDGLRKLIGRNRADTIAMWPSLFENGSSGEACFKMADDWMISYISEHGVPEKKGLRELLSFFHTNEIPCALATGTDRDRASFYLHRASLTGFFHAAVFGDMVTHGKPDPEIFFRAASLLGCTDPGSCLVLEDSYNGLLASSNAGFLTCIVPDLEDPTKRTDTPVFMKADSLLSVRDSLQAFFSAYSEGQIK